MQRLRDWKERAGEPSAIQRQSWDLKPGLSDSEPHALRSVAGDLIGCRNRDSSVGGHSSLARLLLPPADS